MRNSRTEQAIFLGPRAENTDEFERLLLEVLHDHTFWRRNQYAADPRLVTEAEKRSDAYSEASARLRDELYQILAELKQGAPLYSPRQIGHMVSDPSIPALIGYFAGLLYNQNNVVAEAAPETVRKERAYMDALARMVGYPSILPERIPAEQRGRRDRYSWGHLASGGTSANIEAMWVARNVRLYPLAIRLLAALDDRFADLATDEITTVAGQRARLSDLSTFEILNLPIEGVTALHRRTRRWLGQQEGSLVDAFGELLPSVRKSGLAGLMQRHNEVFRSDPMRVPVVLASKSAHYCWGKALDIVGLGANQLHLLPTDRRQRLDLDALEEALYRNAERGVATLMVVGILGSTEEGAVDPIHRIEDLRARMAADGLFFWHHVDAAFGGYLASALPRDGSGRALDYAASGDSLLDRDVYDATAAIERTDSITIDPHKWGYVPYPAGAVLFREYAVRDAIAYAAPYLPTEEEAGFGGFLGRWTIEGSRPGASAVAAYLSQAVLPLDPSGHGEMVRRCLSSRMQLVRALEAAFEGGAVRFRLLAEPDTVGFCFVLVPRGARTLVEVDSYMRTVWRDVSVDERAGAALPHFILSKTEVRAADEQQLMSDVLGPRIDINDGTESLLFLRAFKVNPFVSTWNQHDASFAEQFASFMRDVAHSHLMDQSEHDADGFDDSIPELLLR